MSVHHSGEHIHIADRRIDHGTSGLILLEQFHLFLDLLRLLESHGRGFLLHAFPQHSLYFPQLPIDDLARLIDLVLIGRFALQGFTRRETIANVVLQALLKLSLVYGRFAQVQFAIPDGVDLPNEFENRLHDLDRGIWSKVFGTIFDLFTRIKYSGKAFFFDDDPGIGLVVLQVDIVTRLMLFDQAVLQQQRLEFILGDHRSDIRDLLNHDPGAATAQVLVEIRGNPLFEALGLTDVEDASVLIQMLIDPGLVG